MSEIYGLVVSGGASTRMKKDKGALLYQGQSLRERMLHHLEAVCDRAYISVRSEQFEEQLKFFSPDLFILDQLKDIGPAAALLAAYEKHPDKNWFFVACDFPLAEHKAFTYLAELFNRSSAQNEITCYVHQDGTPEPLFSIWKPRALEKLKVSVGQGLTGPLHTLKQCDPLLAPPDREESLINTNTPEEWARIQL